MPVALPKYQLTRLVSRSSPEEEDYSMIMTQSTLANIYEHFKRGKKSKNWKKGPLAIHWNPDFTQNCKLSKYTTWLESNGTYFWHFEDKCRVAYPLQKGAAENICKASFLKPAQGWYPPSQRRLNLHVLDTVLDKNKRYKGAFVLLQ